MHGAVRIPEFAFLVCIVVCMAVPRHSIDRAPRRKPPPAPPPGNLRRKPTARRPCQAAGPGSCLPPTCALPACTRQGHPGRPSGTTPQPPVVLTSRQVSPMQAGKQMGVETCHFSYRPGCNRLGLRNRASKWIPICKLSLCRMIGLNCSAHDY